MAKQIGAYCDWYDLFEEPEKTVLHEGLLKLAQMSAWTSIVFFTYMFYQNGYSARKPQSVDSYKNLRCYFTAVHIRSVVVLLTGLEAVRAVVRTRFDECHFFAFWETFTAVLEIESWTHVCIERYVVAKYATNGWVIPKDHYTWYYYLSLMFAFGYGVFYTCDYAGCLCDYDLSLPDTWKRRFIVGIFLLKSVKPTAFMVSMLFWANVMESNFDYSMERFGDKELTTIVTVITIVNLIFWMPFSVIRGWALFPQYVLGRMFTLPSTFFIRYGIWMHASSSMMAMISMLLMDLLKRNDIIFVTSTVEKRA